jgi:hypothetical protein
MGYDFLAATITQEKEESWSTKNERQEDYECYFLCFTYRLPVECSSKKVLELQVQYMIDSKNGGRLVYSDVCGLMAYLYMIKRLGLIGNGKLWMALLQRHLLGEKGTGANPTDRAKCGTKRSMVVDGKGVPLDITVDAANRHDMKMTKTTLHSSR